MAKFVDKEEHTETCAQLIGLLFSSDNPIEKSKINQLIKSMMGMEDDQPEAAASTNQWAKQELYIKALRA